MGEKKSKNLDDLHDDARILAGALGYVMLWKYRALQMYPKGLDEGEKKAFDFILELIRERINKYPPLKRHVSKLMIDLGQSLKIAAIDADGK